VGPPRRLGAHLRERRPLQPAPRARISVDRLPALHPAVAPGEDPRAGRWRGAAKKECGLHTTTKALEEGEGQST
jgi:phosphoadenosine phosphosulfate reductase